MRYPLRAAGGTCHATVADMSEPDAGFRASVAEYSRLDGPTTLEVFGRNKDIPVRALVAFIAGHYSA